LDVGELEDMRRLEKIPMSIVKYDQKFEYTGVSISALPILRLSDSLSVQERGLVIGMYGYRDSALYRYRDSLSLDISITGDSISVQGLNIPTKRGVSQGCNLAFLKAKSAQFGLFKNCLPEIKWFGHLAIFLMLTKIVYFKPCFEQI